MDMDGLKASVIRMLTGDSVSINTGTFSNDMTTFATKDDVLTLLVHLGYLTYNSIDGTVSIPNKEVSQEYINAISTMNWHGVADSVEASRKLLAFYRLVYHNSRFFMFFLEKSGSPLFTYARMYNILKSISA